MEEQSTDEEENETVVQSLRARMRWHGVRAMETVL